MDRHQISAEAISNSHYCTDLLIKQITMAITIPATSGLILTALAAFLLLAAVPSMAAPSRQVRQVNFPADGPDDTRWNLVVGLTASFLYTVSLHR